MQALNNDVKKIVNNISDSDTSYIAKPRNTISIYDVQLPDISITFSFLKI